MVKEVSTLPEFVRVCNDMLRSDRDVVLGVAGFTGEGKTTFLIGLMKEYYNQRGLNWGFDLMTWSRKELMLWIDGKKNSPVSKGGLKESQLSEYSGIIADELFKMFYRRNWYEEGQIDAIATFNMCRDRHLLVGGNVPNFWDLDTAFTSRVRFYIYIVERGKAWVFEQENNPFAKDPWNIQENKKFFRKKKNPYGLYNFVCELHFPDLTVKEKEQYLRIRKEKRLRAITENRSERAERYGDIKRQRDELIRLAFKLNKKFTNKDVSDIIGISKEAVRIVRQGLRG